MERVAPKEWTWEAHNLRLGTAVEMVAHVAVAVVNVVDVVAGVQACRWMVTALKAVQEAVGVEEEEVMV